MKLKKSGKKKFGKDAYHCRRCGAAGAVIKQYGLQVCRRCFREICEDVGFVKYS